MIFELGPQLSLRNDDINETYESDGDTQKDVIVDKNLSSSTVFAVMGFGAMPELSESLRLLVGLKFGYGLGDFTQELTAQQLIDAGEDISSFTSYANDEDYQKTHAAFLNFNLGLYYTF